MSEIKFTDEELQSIQNLSNKSNNITYRFGQLKVAKINLEKQLEQLEEEDFKLQEEFIALRKEEQDTLNGITEKYGPGTLDPQSGIYTPTPTPQEDKK